MQAVAADIGIRRSGRVTPTRPRNSTVGEEDVGVHAGSQSKKRARKNSGASAAGSHTRKRVRNMHGSSAQLEDENVDEIMAEEVCVRTELGPEQLNMSQIEEAPDNVVNRAASRKSSRLNSRGGEQTPPFTQRSSGSNQLVDESPAQRKKVERGATHGLSVRRNLLPGQKISVNIPLDKRRPVGAGHSEFTYEVGFAVRMHSRADIPSRNQMKATDKKPIFDHLNVIFELDMLKPHILYAINTMCSRSYRHNRYKLHKHFKSFRSTAEARSNPSPLVNRKDWEIMCNYFASEACKVKSTRGTSNRRKVKILHSGGSNSVVQWLHEMEEPSLIENFKTNHCKSGTGVWLTNDTLDKYNQMTEMRDNDVDHVLTEEQIVEAVLGKRRGFVAGHGSGQVPKTSASYGSGMAEAIARAERVERKAKAARRRARVERKRVEAAEKKLKEIENRLCNVERLLLQNMDIDEPSYEDSEYDPDSQEEAEEEEAQSASEEESVSGSEPELETEAEHESKMGYESEFELDFGTESSAEE